MSAEPIIDDRRELAELAFQAVAWAELEQLFGVTSTIVPPLEPFASVAPVPAQAASSAPASSAPASSAPASNLSSFAARASAALAGKSPHASTPAVSVPAAPAPVAAASAAATEGVSVEQVERQKKLAAIHERLQGCVKCALAQGRTNVVPGQGDPTAELVFVGEGPGETEDRTGLAFVGKAGELLTKMIGAMGLTRDQVYIANIVKCRPPNNRPPAPEEMATCLPYLEEQLAIIRPKVICALGKTAAVGLGLVKPTDALGPSRGRFHEWPGGREGRSPSTQLPSTPVMITYHPSYLLRTPSDKRKAWEDLQKIFPYLTRRSPTPI